MPGPGYYLIGEEEEREVLEVLRSRYLFRYGNENDPGFVHKVVSLEREVCARFGCAHALAVTSGTASLIVALSAAGIGPGDEVIVPGYTFIASMSAVIMCGAVPVLAEIDSSLTLDPEDVERKITPRTRAIMAVHMLGNPCDLDRLEAVATRRKVPLIEDACQALGAQYRGKYLGTRGKIGAYSLNIFKTINAGDGGLVVTDDDELYTRAFAYHDQGHLPMRMGVEVGKRSIIGQNYRMNELTGAVSLAQFRKLDRILGKLREVKGRFKKAITGIPGVAFRRINDEAGECATLLTVFLPSRDRAEAVAKALGTTTVAHSGWHVYANMEQLLGKKTVVDRGPPFHSKEYPTAVEYRKGMLPKTDDILSRAVNISIGVVDAGLGAAFGVNILSPDAEVDRAAERFRQAAGKAL
jgi:dTDP-4-amino-4,6-dideoxygalactose transaminase